MSSSIINSRYKFRQLIFAALACLAANELFAETPATSPTEGEQIEQWSVQLDDDRFDVRQRAQQQLEQSGKPALEAVAALASSGSLESSTRAINILLQWSESKEQDFRFATLEKLASLTNRPRESAMAKRLLADIREQVALKEITKLGGKVKHLGSYANLQIEIDQDWKGGNEGMKLLADVQRVVKIKIRVAPITDSGLKHLAKLPQVRLIEIHGTKISDEVKKELEQQLPTTKIDDRNGPMLGIFGDPNDTIKGSVAVNDVVQDGAAFKAGILPGDRITEIDGKKLEDFTALTTRIATHKVGDTVKLTLLRNGKPQNVKVTFDRWGSTDNEKLVNQKQRNVQQLPLQGLPIQLQVPRR